MRIAINAVTLLGDTSGVGTYTRNLVAALAALDQQNQYRLYYGNARPRNLPPPAGPNFVNIHSRLPGRVRRWLLDACGVPIEWFVGAADILHEPYIFTPPTSHARRVITLFDVIPLRFPKLFTVVLREGWARKVQQAAGRADCIITVSETSRQDIEQYLRIPPSRIRVIPLAPDPCFAPRNRDAASAAVRARYGLNGRLLLNVGRLDPHKNVDRLVEAFHAAVPDLAPTDCLGFTGHADGASYHRVAAKIRDLRLTDRVRFFGHVPLPELVELVNAASTLIIPSLWEGFGLPVLEAMACGTPVITSGVGATRETAEGAAILVEPTDTAALSRSIVNVLQQPELADTLRRKGLERARRFSWATVARQTLDVYADVITWPPS